MIVVGHVDVVRAGCVGISSAATPGSVRIESSRASQLDSTRAKIRFEFENLGFELTRRLGWFESSLGCAILIESRVSPRPKPAPSSTCPPVPLEPSLSAAGAIAGRHIRRRSGAVALIFAPRLVGPSRCFSSPLSLQSLPTGGMLSRQLVSALFITNHFIWRCLLPHGKRPALDRFAPDKPTPTQTLKSAPTENVDAWGHTMYCRTLCIVYR